MQKELNEDSISINIAIKVTKNDCYLLFSHHLKLVKINYWNL